MKTYHFFCSNCNHIKNSLYSKSDYKRSTQRKIKSLVFKERYFFPFVKNCNQLGCHVWELIIIFQKNIHAMKQIRVLWSLRAGSGKKSPMIIFSVLFVFLMLLLQYKLHQDSPYLVENHIAIRGQVPSWIGNRRVCRITASIL